MSQRAPTASAKIPVDRFLGASGVRLHALDWGGDGPPLLLLHATGFHAHMWDPIARRLADRFHVVALDFRGHGDSDKPESGYTWEAMIADVVGALEELGLSKVVAAGHSLGATTAAGAASERPDLFTRLVLVELIVIPREFRDLRDSENPMAEAARRRRDVWPSREAMIASYRPRPPFDTWREESLRLYVDHGTEPLPDGTVRLKCPGRIEAQIFGMAPGFDAWDLLSRVTPPTLLIRGSTSTTLSERDAAEVVATMPRASLHTIPGGHLVPMEAPEDVAAAIEGFSAALPSARTG